MQRTIKSFVLRAGRVSNRQQHALEHYLQAYELPLSNQPWDLQAAFAREAPTIVEIGFGMGSSLITMAEERPDLNFIGIEVHRAGVGSLVADLYERKIENVKVAARDAVEIFQHCLDENSLLGVQVFFPDPWPKKRHQKRRLIQPSFVKLIANRIKPGGFLHCATDWQDYAEQMLAVLSAEASLQNSSSEGGFSERPPRRPLTKFEQRGTGLGHEIWDLIYVKNNGLTCLKET